MRIIDCVQGTPEWWESRKGIPTASNFDRIITPKTMKPSSQQDDYIAELISDTVCQCPPYFTGQGHPVNKAMQNGQDTEPQARRWYELECELSVRQVGFCLHDSEKYGCSPDGLVGEVGGLELKCPLLKTHTGYLMANELPSEYKCQVHGNLLVTGREWWDFVSYSPPLPAFRVRVFPDEFTEKLKEALEAFHEKYMEAMLKIGKLSEVA